MSSVEPAKLGVCEHRAFNIATEIPFLKAGKAAKVAKTAELAAPVAKRAVNALAFKQSNKTLSEFRSVIEAHVSAQGIRVIVGTYRGNPATHFVDPSNGLNVIRDSSGNFLSGWKLSERQLQYVLTSGKLGGG